MNKKIIIFLFFVVACSENSNNIAPVESPPVKYSYYPPNNKLPYPQHNPQYTKEQYDSMMSQLFIINNFGQWQGGETETSQYFHDGIDIVLKNGTKIYAIEDGIVIAILGNNRYYKTLIIQDKDEPNFVWAYTHIYHFKVSVDQEVKQGSFLASVNFKGVEHIHLSRAKIIDKNEPQSYSSYEKISPIGYFNYPDSEAPVIKTPFYFYRNQTDSLISNDSTPIIGGKVDIVVGMRDRGEHARGTIGDLLNFGDRLCVAKIEYTIKGENSEEELFSSFDFSKISFVYSNDQYKKVKIAYKSPFLIKNGINGWDKYFSYYIITNWKEKESISEFNSDDDIQCWDTTEL